jgi:hypothetical protein
MKLGVRSSVLSPPLAVAVMAVILYVGHEGEGEWQKRNLNIFLTSAFHTCIDIQFYP